MSRAGILTLIFLFSVLFVSRLTVAQDISQYQLHEPVAEEYLRFVSGSIVACGWEPTQTYSRNPWDLCAYTLLTIEQNYRDELKSLPYDLLVQVFNALQPGLYWNTPGDIYLWHEALILSWLRDNNIDLRIQTELSISDMLIQVEPRDFNADGIDEYLLEIEGSRFATFFVLRREEDGSYRQIPAWLPYHNGAVPYWDYQANELREIAFGDFNADGLPEWFLAFDGASYRGEYLGQVFLLGWRDGELRSLSDSLPYIPFFDTNANNLHNDTLQEGYIFQNLDADSALELQSIEMTSDNWHCQQRRIRVYNWDASADSYIQLSDGLSRAETANCVMNDAENALFNQNYTAAAYLYNYAIGLPLEYLEASSFNAEFQEFMQLRLVQAYLLNREYETADLLLNTVETAEMASSMLNGMRDILLSHRLATPGETCTALYNFFESAISDSFNYGAFQEEIGTQLTVGMQWQFHGDFIGAGNPANPAYAGCNVPGIIDPYLERDFYPNQYSPIEYLEGSGFPIVEYFQADFNGDARLDWLIWYEANIPAVLFLNQGENTAMLVSRVWIDQPGEYVTAVTVDLPQNAGTALVLFRAIDGLPSYFGGFKCGSATVLGLVELWQYSGDTLMRLESRSWCDDYPSVNELFRQEGDENVLYLRDDYGELSRYVWNAETRRYGLPVTATAEATQELVIPNSQDYTAAEQVVASNEELYNLTKDGFQDYYFRLDQQIQQANPDEAIAILDAEINASYMDYPFPLQFWKARLLQEAGRDNEALTEYIAIYESSPESIWGKLAALYFESIHSGN
jgi:hypothetical protein